MAGTQGMMMAAGAAGAVFTMRMVSRPSSAEKTLALPDAPSHTPVSRPSSQQRKPLRSLLTNTPSFGYGSQLKFTYSDGDE